MIATLGRDPKSGNTTDVTETDWSKYEPVAPHEQLVIDAGGSPEEDKRTRRQQRGQNFRNTGDLD